MVYWTLKQWMVITLGHFRPVPAKKKNEKKIFKTSFKLGFLKKSIIYFLFNRENKAT